MATPVFRGLCQGMYDWYINGFDDEGRPPHCQRLPVGETVKVCLQQGGNLSLKIKEYPPVHKGVITISENLDLKSAPTRYIFIKGLREGNTEIWAQSGGTTIEKLCIQVWNVKPVRVAFRFLQDTATPTPHRSRRPKNEVDKLLLEVNKIYRFQAAIQFVKHSVADVTVKGNWDSYILVPKGELAFNQFYLKMLSLCDPSANWNVFFAWSVEDENKKLGKDKKHIDTEGVNIKNLCLMDDVITPQFYSGHVLAHEAGHFLGLTHCYLSTKYLMYEYNNGGKFFSTSDAIKMRDNVSRLSLPKREDQKG